VDKYSKKYKLCEKDSNNENNENFYFILTLKQDKPYET
jgi:hypothetical protein